MDGLLDELRDWLDVASELSYSEGRKATSALGERVKELAALGLLVGVRQRYLLFTGGAIMSPRAGGRSTSSSTASAKPNWPIGREPARSRGLLTLKLILSRSANCCSASLDRRHNRMPSLAQRRHGVSSK